MNFTAVPHRRYRAQIKLGVFEQVVNNDGLRARLEAVGLTNVKVEGSGRQRLAFGDWTGDRVVVELPSQIVAVDDLGPC